MSHEDASVTIVSLTKTKNIRVYDVSAGGCLLESRESLPVGAVGLLSIDVDGRRRQEWIRVCRVHANEGRRGTCLVSVEFLPLEPAGADSLRGAMLRLRAVKLRGRFPAMSGRSSGDPGKSVRVDETLLAMPGRGDERHQLIPVDESAVLICDDNAIGVAVERDAYIGARLDDLGAHRLRRCRAALLIDIEPVGIIADGDGLGTEFP